MSNESVPASALAPLTHRQQLIFVLSYLEELSAWKIGQLLGYSTATVARDRARIRAYFAATEESELREIACREAGRVREHVPIHFGAEVISRLDLTLHVAALSYQFPAVHEALYTEAPKTSPEVVKAERARMASYEARGQWAPPLKRKRAA